MRKQLYISLLFALLSFSLNAQKLKTLLEDGDKAFSEKDYFAASLYYNKAILKDSTDINIQYKYAEASRLNYDFEEAEKWYEKVNKLDRSGKIYPECDFWLATIKKHKGEYVEAKKLFQKYAKKHKRTPNDYFVKKANQEIAACDLATLLTANPDKSITIIHLDSAVNSVLSEYAPIKKDSTLYFSSLRNGSDRDDVNKINYNKIYASDLDTTNWLPAIELGEVVNKNEIHNANTAFNEDYTKAYITRCEQKNAAEFICEIYVSELKSGRWSPLVKLPEPINKLGYTNTQPAVGFLGDKKVLFFSSNRPKGEGGMDIWYSEILPDGKFGEPVNSGKKVNSIEDEITPFYCKPCQELFFSSNWHQGLGGFDVFKSKFENDELGEPTNLGSPINSNYNDIYFTISSDKKEAYLSSNRKGSFFEEKETCCNDIFMFEIPQPRVEKKEEVKEEEKPEEVAEKKEETKDLVTQMKELVPITLYFHNDEPDKKTLDTVTKLNYKKTYEDYTVMRPLYLERYTESRTGDKLEHAKSHINILFDNFVDAGMRDLEKFSILLLESMKKNEKIIITMKGFCSPLASTDYNVNLAKRRMSSLYNYFVEYEGGVFLPFINNVNDEEKGRIIFKYDDIGELQAKPNVSDDYYDTKNSIYNPAAALERKIQIIAVSSFISQ